jgi:hypothetical protein
MEDLIVLINFNSYLGGGETLFVRFSAYLEQNGYNFLSICLKDSYIYQDLQRYKIPQNKIKAIFANPDYYYLDKNDRKRFLDILKEEIGQSHKITVRFVSFCLRDLYTVFALSCFYEKCSITHLILHIEDDLYVCQTLLDKLLLKLFNKRYFGNINNKRFNQTLLLLLNKKQGLISMADVINRVWKAKSQIEIPDIRTIPLPSFTYLEEAKTKRSNNKKIIWIGRLVDFKIPSLCAMIEFVDKHDDYYLSIVGAGDKQKIKKYARRHNLDLSRVTFVGEILYQDLGQIIDSHSIGYAMGTSLVELSQYRIPVIIALASFNHNFFDKRICGGLFYNQRKGCDGSELQITPIKQIDLTIDDAIKKIENDYQNIADACYNFARDGFSLDRNFSDYILAITQTKLLDDKDQYIDLPSASTFRRYIYRKYSNSQI